MMTEEKSIVRNYARRFTRVGLSRTVTLYLDGDFFEDIAIRNLSVGGLFVEGQYICDVGEKCEVELQETGQNSSLLLKLTAMVRRVESDGLALEFIEMTRDSLMFLQTVVLYSANNPCDAAEEFLEDFFKVTGERC